MSWAEFSSLDVQQVRPGVIPERSEVEFQYTMKQLYELKTGDKIKDPVARVGVVVGDVDG